MPTTRDYSTIQKQTLDPQDSKLNQLRVCLICIAFSSPTTARLNSCVLGLILRHRRCEAQVLLPARVGILRAARFSLRGRGSRAQEQFAEYWKPVLQQPSGSVHEVQRLPTWQGGSLAVDSVD